VIIHYAVGPDKPWLPKSTHPQASLYRDYAKMLAALREDLSIIDPSEDGETGS
jgi:hypothetical protein